MLKNLATLLNAQNQEYWNIFRCKTYYVTIARYTYLTVTGQGIKDASLGRCVGTTYLNILTYI